MAAMSQVSELKASIADSIEKQIVKGLLAACIHAPPGSKQNEALHSVAKAMGMTEDELKQAGISISGADPSSKSGSLGAEFVRFLESETTEQANLRLSLAPTGVDDNTAVGTPPTPLNLFRRWPFSASKQQRNDPSTTPTRSVDENEKSS